MNVAADTLPIERHFTISELSKQFHLAESTTRNLFIREPGVIKISHALRKGKMRAYTTVRVPESVAMRVYARLVGHRP